MNSREPQAFSQLLKYGNEWKKGGSQRPRQPWESLYLNCLTCQAQSLKVPASLTSFRLGLESLYYNAPSTSHTEVGIYQFSENRVLETRDIRQTEFDGERTGVAGPLRASDQVQGHGKKEGASLRWRDNEITLTNSVKLFDICWLTKTIMIFLKLPS